jgi:hypothetical protein
MSATHYDLTIPTKSEPKGSGVQWTPSAADGPSAGVLTIEGKRNRCSYVLCEFPADFAGRAFMLTKLDAGTDKAEERYSCFVARDGKNRLCECKGFHFAGHCRHLEALDALLANGWL